MANKRGRRGETAHRVSFEAAISWAGLVLVAVFLLWTIAMAVFQAFEQWRK
jgi:hypothetical protein